MVCTVCPVHIPCCTHAPTVHTARTNCAHCMHARMHNISVSQYWCPLSAKSFSENLWVWVTEHLRCLSVPDSDYVFLTLWSFYSCLWHCVLHCEHCTHTLCTLHARGRGGACMRCACPVHALCMLGGLRGTGRVCIQTFRNDAMNDASQVALHDLEIERDGKGF